MKVALITSWDERCGIAEYARNLTENLPGIAWEIHQRPFSWPAIARTTADVVHVNHEPGLMGWLEAEQLTRLKATGKKIVLTMHASNEISNKGPLTQVADRVVLHEKTSEGFAYIPMGVPEWSGTTEEYIGLATAGFPFHWKGFWATAAVAKKLEIPFRAVIPESQHGDAKFVKQQLTDICPWAEIQTRWMERQAVIDFLALAKVQVFAYWGHNAGISAAVRLGLATGRATVVSRSRQFRDLTQDYGDEVYVVQSDAPTPEQLEGVVREALTGGRRPKRILQDMHWTRVARQYEELYRGMWN